MKIGFIGLGMMGRHMATNFIKAGYEVVVHDLRREAAEPHCQAGASWADTPRKVAEVTDVVFTSLPGPPEVEAVALGKQGLLEGLTAGKVYFDLSTNSPTLVRRLNEVFAARGIHMLDAPVSGGVKGAEKRKLALWIGGDEAVFTRYKPVLDAIGDQVFYVGPIGAGSIAKLVHNCAAKVLQLALAEVFTMGVKAGVDPLMLWKAVRQGAVGRRRTFDGLADYLLPGNFEPVRFALRLAHKDIALACNLAREHNVPMRLANMTLEDTIETLNRGWKDRDSQMGIYLQEERAGVEIRVPEALIRQELDAASASAKG